MNFHTLKEKDMTAKMKRFSRFTALIALTGALLFPALRPGLAEGNGAGSGGAVPPFPWLTTSAYIYYSDGSMLFADSYVLPAGQNSDGSGGHVRPFAWLVVQTSAYTYYTDGTVLFADGYVLRPAFNADPQGGHIRPIL